MDSDFGTKKLVWLILIVSNLLQVSSLVTAKSYTLDKFYPPPQALAETYTCCAYYGSQLDCHEEDRECIEEY